MTETPAQAQARRGRRGFFGLGAAGLAAACAAPERGPAVPRGRAGEATVLGVPNERFVIGSTTRGFAALEREFEEAAQRRARHLGLRSASEIPRYDMLGVSGGGEDGAFGAGLICGWTAQGTRPVFELVTGVSTGALTAPFAFLGPDWDPQLRSVYTDITPREVLETRGLIAAVFNDALADNAPLYHTISRHLDQRMLAALAQAYREGRLLLVASTNLDAQMPVIWNIGAIAASGHPRALELVRRLLLASAAIPGAFPPVMIDVTVHGQPYQEMHVDGGATMEVFLYPTALGAEARRQNVLSPYRDRQAYIIRNARLDSEWREIDRNTLSIMGRAVDQLIQSQGYGDLQRIYLTTKRDHIGFNLAYIGPDFKEPHTGSFDRKYMNALYNYGRGLARAGYPWAQTPPGFDHALNDDVRVQVNRQRQLLKGQPASQPVR